MNGTSLGLKVVLARHVMPSRADGVHFFLDEKTNLQQSRLRWHRLPALHLR
jgi:hypothetical protein